jgi:addiction module RelE/StbE family toxin
MYKLSWSSGFRRAYKKVTKKSPHLEEKIFSALEKLLAQPFNPELKTHKLHGKLAGLWACEVEYDCRIVFTFADERGTGETVIVLADIGTHDEVY